MKNSRSPGTPSWSGPSHIETSVPASRCRRSSTLRGSPEDSPGRLFRSPELPGGTTGPGLADLGEAQPDRLPENDWKRYPTVAKDKVLKKSGASAGRAVRSLSEDGIRLG